MKRLIRKWLGVTNQPESNKASIKSLTYLYKDLDEQVKSVTEGLTHVKIRLSDGLLQEAGDINELKDRLKALEIALDRHSNTLDSLSMKLHELSKEKGGNLAEEVAGIKLAIEYLTADVVKLKTSDSAVSLKTRGITRANTSEKTRKAGNV